jgi:hypothetical protein
MVPGPEICLLLAAEVKAFAGVCRIRLLGPSDLAAIRGGGAGGWRCREGGRGWGREGGTLRLGVAGMDAIKFK